MNENIEDNLPIICWDYSQQNIDQFSVCLIWKKDKNDRLMSSNMKPIGDPGRLGKLSSLCFRRRSHNPRSSISSGGD